MTQLSTSEWIAVFSGIIALLAFFATAWQAYLMRQHNHLSSRPVLDVDIHCRPSEIIGIIVVNSGPGPAFIKTFTVTFRKIAYSLISESEFKQFSTALVEAGLRVKEFYKIIPSKETVISPGQQFPILVIPDKDNREAICVVLDRISDELRFEIVYKSLYERTYKVIHDKPVVNCA